MAVLVEAISVIVRVDSINEKFPGGWIGFKDHVPNQTLCADNELARVGFIKALDDDCALLAVDIHLAKRQQFGEPPATINKSLAGGASLEGSRRRPGTVQAPPARGTCGVLGCRKASFRKSSYAT